MADELTGYEVLLGVSGGIAAYKAAWLCSQLVQRGVGVTVAMTEHGRQFVGTLTFSTLSGREVYTDLFGAENVYDAQHVTLTEKADLVVVAPATANIMAKMAAGICDDLLSTLLCTSGGDILLAPAMNCRMWENPATQRNIATLREQGCQFIGPESGRLACGDEGVGRMSEPGDILERICEMLEAKGKRQEARGKS